MGITRVIYSFSFQKHIMDPVQLSGLQHFLQQPNTARDYIRGGWSDYSRSWWISKASKIYFLGKIIQLNRSSPVFLSLFILQCSVQSGVHECLRQTSWQSITQSFLFQRNNPNDCADPLILPPAPKWGWCLQLEMRCLNNYWMDCHEMGGRHWFFSSGSI